MSAPTPRREQYLHRFFEISLVAKALFAILEISTGAAAYFVSPALVGRVVGFITRGELTEDPRDLVANILMHWARGLSVGSQHFTALYLFSHGMLKLWLVIGLLRERLWYYPLALVVFAAFIGYQLDRYSFTHSAWLLLLTAVDFVVIGLTWHEMQYLRRLRANRP